MTKKFNRRLFLLGAGVTLGLPFLPSALSRRERAMASGDLPRRFLGYYTPNGWDMPSFVPDDEGTDYTLSPTLEALGTRGVKEDVLLITGLCKRYTNTDDHHNGTGAFLTGQPLVGAGAGDERPAGGSLDQRIAEAIGSATALPSLQLGMEDTIRSDHRVSDNTISFVDSETALPKITDPSAAFDQLFAGVDPGATDIERMRRRLYGESVIDFALEETNRIKGSLGRDDKVRLDEYLTGLRQLEMAIMDEPAGSGGTCTVPDRPMGDAEWLVKLDQMHDLLVLALQCDRTRVITFMQAHPLSERMYGLPGVSVGHHVASHHNVNQVRLIEKWQVDVFAKLVDKLKTAREADGTSLLDTMCFYFASECGDGNGHKQVWVPCMIAGNLCGEWTTGRHVLFPDNWTDFTPMNNLFARILVGFGIEPSTFGADSTTPLAEV